MPLPAVSLVLLLQPVSAVPVQPVRDVPLQIDAVASCRDGVIPAVYCAAVQRKPHALGIALSIGDPVADVKRRLGLSRFRLLGNRF